MSEKDKGNLLAIIDACDKIKKYAADFWDADSLYADEKTFDAVLMNFVVIGEAVIRLSENLKLQESHIPWSKIKGFRNILAHDYFGVDAEEVWQIINQNLADLGVDIHKIIEDLED
jgi:uncharacterized protein with HEPN domain